jgi:hypothetical protein
MLSENSITDVLCLQVTVGYVQYVEMQRMPPYKYITYHSSV